MADKGKVMKALKCRVTDPVVECGNCPYNDAPDDWRQRCDFHRLCADALALLKEQEARVLTLEEVIHSKDWIWYEWENTYTGWAIVINCDKEWIEWNDSTTDQLCKYGKEWRCWSARPTEEQMRDTKWEGEKD